MVWSHCPFGHLHDEGADHKLELHAHVHGHRRLCYTHRFSHGDRIDEHRTDAHVVRVTHIGRVGRYVEADVVVDEYDELHCIERLDRFEDDLGHVHDTLDHVEQELHARMHRQRRHCDEDGGGGGAKLRVPRRDAQRVAQVGRAEWHDDAHVERYRCHELHRLGRMVRHEGRKWN